MIAKVNYLGLYPLGSELEINSIQVMKAEWHRLRKPLLFLFGKGTKEVCPCFCEIFVAKSNEQTAYFAALENRIGKYHIFSFSEKAVNKINKHRKKHCIPRITSR